MQNNLRIFKDLPNINALLILKVYLFFCTD